MALRIRRGSDPARQGVRFELGELVWTTDGQQLWVGDGSTTGGVPVVGSNIVGYGLTYNGTSKRIEVSGLSTDDVSEGTNRKYFSQELAQDAAALLFTTGVHTGVQFQYDDNLGRINATIDASAFVDLGILSVGSDTSPELGGALDLNGFNITGTGNIDIVGSIETVGTVNITGDIISNGVISSPVFTASSLENTVVFKSNASESLDVYSVATGGNVPGVFLKVSNGTVSIPTNTAPSDFLGGFKVSGLYDGTYKIAAGMVTQWDADANMAVTNPKSTIYFGTGDNTNDGNNIATFNGSGVFSAPTLSAGDGTASAPSIRFGTDGGTDSGLFHPGDGIICISTDSTERVRVDNGGLRVVGFIKVKDFNGSLPTPPEAGMIVLDAGTFKGYNGTDWVTLG
jgi:hypothetical protein